MSEVRSKRWMCFIVIFAINLSTHVICIHGNFPSGLLFVSPSHQCNNFLRRYFQWRVLTIQRTSLVSFDVVSINSRTRSNWAQIFHFFFWILCCAVLLWLMMKLIVGPYLISVKLECMQIMCRHRSHRETQSSHCSQLAIICHISPIEANISIKGVCTVGPPTTQQNRSTEDNFCAFALNWQFAWELVYLFTNSLFQFTLIQ